MALSLLERFRSTTTFPGRLNPQRRDTASYHPGLRLRFGIAVLYPLPGQMEIPVNISDLRIWARDLQVQSLQYKLLTRTGNPIWVTYSNRINMFDRTTVRRVSMYHTTVAECGIGPQSKRSAFICTTVAPYGTNSGYLILSEVQIACTSCSDSIRHTNVKMQPVMPRSSSLPAALYIAINDKSPSVIVQPRLPIHANGDVWILVGVHMHDCLHPVELYGLSGDRLSP
jgi:hypothetical protein